MTEDSALNSGKTEADSADEEEVVEEGLSEAFFSCLTKQPSCRANGVCDGCGRCEH